MLIAYEQEVWKPVAGYRGLYEVSDFGRVKALARTQTLANRWGSTTRRTRRERILSPSDNGVGYLAVWLVPETNFKHIKLVHRLVAEAFLPRDPARDFVNHKDGAKMNNALANLEWCTRSENMLHAHATGLAESPKMAVVATCTRTGAERRFASQIAAEIELAGSASSAVHHCLVGKKKTAYGFTWRRA